MPVSVILLPQSGHSTRTLSTSCKRKIPRLPGPCPCTAGATTTANITPMNAPRVQAVHSDRDTGGRASSILPAELWLDIMCLCQPSSHLPATCCTTSSQPGSPAHRIWAHRHIFLNPKFDPKVVNSARTSASQHAEINSWYPRAAQCESHLAYYLKAHVPTNNDLGYECAAGLAPEPGHDVPATVFSVAMVEWLFSAVGPFGRQSHQAKEQELDVLAVLAQVRPYWASPSDSVEGDPAIPSPATTLVKQPPLPTWRLVPDPFLLAHFFVRTSQLDLLELTLNRMRPLFPALLSSTVPFSLWSGIMLDDRTHLRSFLNQLVDSGTEDPNDNPDMSYPMFLCFLTLIDWSKPALDVVASVFADSFDATIAAKLVTSNHHMMNSIFSTLDQLTSPPSDSSRVLSILDWFQANDAHINLDDFPSLSNHITGSYSIFADVFLLRDRGNLPLLVDNPARHVLGSTIAHWVIKGHPDLLSMALENDFLDDEDKSRLLRHAAETGDVDGLLATVAASCTGSEDVLTNAVLDALKTHTNNDDPDPPNMYSTLLNALVTYGPPSLDPTAILIEHSRTWSRRVLSIIMFDLPAGNALLFSWDYARYLYQQLTWASNYWEIQVAGLEFISALIDKCIEEGRLRWDTMNAKRAATACALRLGAAAFKYKLIVGQDKPSEVKIVDDKDVGAIEFLASLAAAKIAAANASTESDDGKSPFSSHVSPGARDLLRAAIQSATSFSPMAACPCDPLDAHSTDCPVSNPRAIHNLLFDTLYTLDRAYVLAHVAWRHPASVRVWHRFEPAEVTSRINVHSAIGTLRAATCALPAHQTAHRVTGAVNGLPRLLLESKVFLLGLRAFIQAKGVRDERKEAMMRGLDASRWGQDWREQIARVTPLPEDDDPEVEEEFDLFE